jgi:Rieske Fe-S protein
MSASVHDCVKAPDPGPAQKRDRRAFFIGAIYGLWTLIGAALTLPAMAYLFLPPKARREQEWADAGELVHLQPNIPEEVVFRRTRVDGWRVSSEKSTAWVVKQRDARVIAFSPTCTHLGCAVHWDERNKNFLCPCHTSAFDLNGNVLTGPAPRALDRYQVRVDAGKLRIGPLEPPQQLS